MKNPSDPNPEILKTVAAVSGWVLPDERIPELAALYKGIADDSRILRTVDLTAFPPATVYRAE